MPILSQGYEPLRAPLREGGARYLPIAWAGLRRNFRWWVRALLVIGLLFGSGYEYIIIFFTYGITALGAPPHDGNAVMRLISDGPNFYAGMMHTQSWWALVLGGVVGAGEIAEDLRTGALVFYLGRPVTRRDYVLGKVLVVSAPVLAVSVAPALLLFAWHAVMVGESKWLLDRWHLPLSILAQGAILCTVLSALVLGVSALARRRRWATVFVGGLYLGLWLTGTILATPRVWSAQEQNEKADRILRKAATEEGREEARRVIADASGLLDSRRRLRGWMFVSPSASLAACGQQVFGRPLPDNFGGGRHWWYLLGLTTLGFAVLGRRVRAVEVVT